MSTKLKHKENMSRCIAMFELTFDLSVHRFRLNSPSNATMAQNSKIMFFICFHQPYYLLQSAQFTEHYIFN